MKNIDIQEKMTIGNVVEITTYYDNKTDIDMVKINTTNLFAPDDVIVMTQESFSKLLRAVCSVKVIDPATGEIK